MTQPELSVREELSQWMTKRRVKDSIFSSSLLYVYPSTGRGFIKGMWRYINCKCLFAVNHRVWESFVNDCECRAA